MAFRPSQAELNELLKVRPQLKEKLAQTGFKAQRKPREILPVTRNEKELLEQEIQAAYFDWVLNPDHILLYPELDLIYAIPNGTNKNALQRHLHQLAGLRSGVPDIHIPVSRKPFFSLYIELKTYSAYRQKNHKCYDNQLLWHEKLRKQGHRVEVHWSVLETIRLTKEYLGYGG